MGTGSSLLHATKRKRGEAEPRRPSLEATRHGSLLFIAGLGKRRPDGAPVAANHDGLLDRLAKKVERLRPLFDEVFETHVELQLFKAFLQGEFVLDLYTFVVACHRFEALARSSACAVARGAAAARIYDAFLDVRGEAFLTQLPSDACVDVRAAIDGQDVDAQTFNAAKLYVVEAVFEGEMLAPFGRWLRGAAARAEMRHLSLPPADALYCDGGGGGDGRAPEPAGAAAGGALDAAARRRPSDVGGAAGSLDVLVRRRQARWDSHADDVENDSVDSQGRESSAQTAPQARTPAELRRRNSDSNFAAYASAASRTSRALRSLGGRLRRSSDSIDPSADAGASPRPRRDSRSWPRQRDSRSSDDATPRGPAIISRQSFDSDLDSESFGRLSFNHGDSSPPPRRPKARPERRRRMSEHPSFSVGAEARLSKLLDLDAFGAAAPLAAPAADAAAAAAKAPPRPSHLHRLRRRSDTDIVVHFTENGVRRRNVAAANAHRFNIHIALDSHGLGKAGGSTRSRSMRHVFEALATPFEAEPRPSESEPPLDAGEAPPAAGAAPSFGAARNTTDV
ncbi:hypothetical protein M885DRAFT_517073 [Pelagophyceae sp. CCMP2097]|nr:hypothetical protein M885DRAFT_517073 [Pelagophyceae sp. CCMP2097]